MKKKQYKKNPPSKKTAPPPIPTVQENLFPGDFNMLPARPPADPGETEYLAGLKAFNQALKKSGLLEDGLI